MDEFTGKLAGKSLMGGIVSDQVDLAHEDDFCLGSLNVSPSHCRLSGDTGRLSIEPKVMQALVVLAATPGASVSKDDLIQRCWNLRFVGDASINRAISLLRAALCKASGDAVGIETVPKVGYRLVVRDIEPAEGTTQLRADHAPNRRSFGLLAGAVALSMVAAVGGGYVWHKQATERTLTVAILPFETLTEGEDYFTYGLQERLRSDLAKAGNVRVTVPASAARYVEAGLGPDEIAKRIKADVVIGGKVARAKGSIRVDVALHANGEAAHSWHHRFSNTTPEAQALVERVGSALREQLNLAAPESSAGNGLRGPDYAIYLVAQGMILSRDPAQLPAARTILRTLVSTHPNYAEGRAALAKSLLLGASSSAGEEDKARREAFSQIGQALKLAPESAEVLAVAGLAGASLDKSVDYLTHAVAVDPGHMEAWLWLGHAYIQRSDMEGALEAYRQVQKIDPLWQRSLFAPDTAAEIGMTALADELDASIGTASIDQWQRNLAEARIARRHGDWSEFVRLAQVASRDAPSGERGIIDREVAMARAYLGVGVEPFGDTLSCMLGLRLLRGQPLPVDFYPPWFRQEFWFGDTLTVLAPPSLVSQGREDILLERYDAAFASPADFYAGIRLLGGLNPIDAAPYVILALRKAGRDGEAREIYRNSLALLKPRAGGPQKVEGEFLLAKLHAAMGDRKTALDMLELARSHGWPNTASPDFAPPVTTLAKDPAFLDLVSDSRFRRFAGAVETERARERRDILAGVKS